MEVTMKEGNYNKCGVCEANGGYIFTFVGEKEQECYVRIYNKENQLLERILVPKTYCKGSLRSVWINGLQEKDIRYDYEIDGKTVIDPYAEKIYGREVWNNLERKETNYAVYCGREKQGFRWEEDVFPEVPRSEMVMYKLHVRGFSMDSGIKGRKKGTFAAVMDKIPYLKELGVTTVEFMPLYEFEEIVLEEKPEIPAYIKEKMKKEEDENLPEEGGIKAVGLNYWGYGSGNYFAVKSSYASTSNASKEFKTLVKAMHQNGLECIMEMHFPHDMNQNVIRHVLNFWVREYHVDGFHLLGESIPVKAICQDMFLGRTKIFCEYFEWELYDTNKAYPNLYVYNDAYLYQARKLLNRMGGSLEEFANQQRKQNKNIGFVNYLANNNGFTLMDTFSYQEKHNEENGENNTDGNNWNFSNNYGAEGKCNKRYVNEMRKQQILNAYAMLFLGQGVPLILAGDEMGNTQNGNNNAYCQDNPTGWLNWKKDRRNGWIAAFIKQMVGFRKEHPIIRLSTPMNMTDYGHKGYPDLSYHGESAWLSGFYSDNTPLGIMYCGDYAKKENGENDDYIYVGYNFHFGKNYLALPKLPKNKNWYLVMDTENTKEPFEKEAVCLENQQKFEIKAQSVVILIGK